MQPQNSLNPFFVSSLRCEGLENPRLVDTAKPRFSWKMQSDRRGVCQSAYQIRIGASAELEKILWDSEKVDSEESLWVCCSGFEPQAKRSYRWQVRVWDEKGAATEWSDWAQFSTGLMGGSWPAEWISDGEEVAVGEAPPARYFRKEFNITQKAIRATLYISALGVVKPWVNGKCVSEDCFSPGWPDYRKRAFYVSYDLTDSLQAGANALGVVLGDAWYSGTLFLDHQYAPTPKFSAWLEIEAEDGSVQFLKTGSDWFVGAGPIQAQGIYFGESYDARLEDPSWSCAGSTNTDWKPVTLEDSPAISIDPRLSPPVRRIEEVSPVDERKVDATTHIYDLGQNMVGWVRLKLQAAAGTEIRIRFAEMLEPDGGIHTANLRKAQATARYIAKGNGREEWEPEFSFFGFRYVELSGIESPLSDAITGVVVHSDLPRVGYFDCSNQLLNKLYSNTLWGQKGNFLELPTDCPQRDERLGWTGDAQVFCNTALYNMDAGNFYRQWLAAVRDSFEPGPEGGFGCVAPFTGFARGSAGWADGGAVVPWKTWLHTGDRAILEESFDSVCDWVDLMRESAPEGIRISKEGWGDWLAPWYPQREAPTPYRLIATAYYAYCTQIAIWMAEELGETLKAEQYQSLLTEVKSAFQREFISEDGKVESDEQTAYLLALGFDLVQEDKKPAMVGQLLSALSVRENHLSTGFIGTPLINPVLSEVGHTDLAYEVVLQETYPGWLYSIKNGASTIWERWDSWTPEQGFHPKGMNSFNHYAYGAVVEWFYERVAGLRIDPAKPGWKHFTVAPEPGGGLTHASASVETPYGKAVSKWKVLEGGFQFEITVPANSTCTVILPVHSIDQVAENGAALDELTTASALQNANGKVSFELSSGNYRFYAKND